MLNLHKLYLKPFTAYIDFFNTGSCIGAKDYSTIIHCLLVLLVIGIFASHFNVRKTSRDGVCMDYLKKKKV